jgi:hypothetical protein
MGIYEGDHVGDVIPCGGRFDSSEVQYLFGLGIILPNFPPNLIISFVSLLFQGEYIFISYFTL